MRLKSSMALVLIVVAFWVATRGVAVPGLALDRDGVLGLAEDYNARFFGGRLDPEMVTTIAFIESSFNPTATRPEVRIGDASVGLMQTLVGTARWLFDVQGYRLGERPSFANLFDAEQSLYYGMAYIDYLKTKNGLTKGRDDQTIVRGYNGGPGNANSTVTDGYWRKYQAAKAELF